MMEFSSVSTSENGSQAPARRIGILVLGMHRSGTSALTRVLNLLGASLPQNMLSSVEHNNPTGFFESARLRVLHDRMLVEGASRWDDWRSFDPSVLGPERLSFYKEEIRDLLEEEYGDAPLLVLKDPRICRFVPLYEEVLAGQGIEPRFILPHRNPLAVTASLAKRDGMTEGFAGFLWLRHVLDAEKSTRGKPRALLSYETLLGNWRRTIRRVTKTLELAWPCSLDEAAAEIDAHLCRDLQHHRPTFADLDTRGEFPAWIKEAYAALQALAGAGGRSEEALATLTRVRRAFEGAASVFGDATFPELATREGKLSAGVRRITRELRQRDRSIEALAAQKEAVAAEQRRLADELGRRDRQIEDLTAQKEAVAAERQRLADELGQRDGQIEELTAQKETLAAEQQRVAGTLRQWCGRIDVLAAQVAALETDVGALREVQAATGGKLLESQTAISELTNQVTVSNQSRRRGLLTAIRAVVNDLRGLVPARRTAELDISASPAMLTPTDSRSAPRDPRATEVQKEPGSIQGLPGVDPGSKHAATLYVTDEHIARARAAVDRADVGLFSIVMPSWNRREIVGRAIESVLAQSYKNWELIVCDDGSTDGTDEYVRERFGSYIASGKIRYLRLGHLGVSAARNAGLRAARGRWMAYLDSDNAWHPHYLLLTAAGYASTDYHRTAYACVHVHDEAHHREFIRCQSFDWSRLLSRNFIDLNVFSHNRDLYEQLGGFDESLTRLVDWDLILRYTQLYEPQFNSFVLCDYYVSHQLENITLRVSLDTNETAVRRKFATASARNGINSPRLAYILWDWPALSQTFVLEELRELRRREIDVRVYYAVRPDRAAQNVPDVIARRVSDAEELARFLAEDERNWIHSHFAYPAVTQLAWPAAEKAGIAFSFMPHAVDIFNHANRERNRIAEIASSPLCARVMVYGDHHRRFLTERGVPAEKIIMTPQAVETAALRAGNVSVRARRQGEPLRILTIGRFIEKKGIEHLIEAAVLLDPGSVEIRIYGYGPLEDSYRNLIDRYGLEATVSLHGPFEGSDALRDALAWADVFCLPCVEAENGDVDGMPTVFFEAMAAGVPCIAGAVSAIPDFISEGINGFLVPPRDTLALAATLRRVAELPADTLAAVAQAARNWTDEHLGAPHAIDTLLDSSAYPPLDIFMVTYQRDGRGEWSATERAIKSVLHRTTTPLVLTIVDNGSEEDFLDQLRSLARGDSRIRLLELGQNLMCGPASNIALRLARSEFVFYVCSNEGYVARTGWERPCLRYMRNRPHVAMGGRLVSSPSWHDGRGYMRQEWFADFRHPEFAQNYPDREFFHIQGGLWVLRRSVYDAVGGFSDRCPQAQTDVEYSYFLESRGYTLGDIPGILVLSNKTRPGLDAFLDETVLAAHPIFDDDVGLVEACTNASICRCNICGWRGRVPPEADGIGFDCPQCASSPRDRAAFRWLAASNLHHRGFTLDARGLGAAVRDKLENMFSLMEGPASVEIPDCIDAPPSRMLGISAPTRIASKSRRSA
jgi:glycosyltransferase involved in cell wall biosynthesis